MRKQWPPLSNTYGLHPWHIDPDRPHLTYAEIAAYKDHFNQQQRG